MKKRFYIGTVILILLILINGCASKEKNLKPNPIESKLVYMGELSEISVSNLRLIVSGEDQKFSIINAEVSNNSNDYLSIDYRVQWLDDIGTPVGLTEEWKNLSFSPLQRQNIKASATAKSAVDFKLELKSKN